VIEKDALDYDLGGHGRDLARRALKEMGLVRIHGSYPARWITPIRADTDLKAERNQRYADRHERHKTKRSRLASTVEYADLPFCAPSRVRRGSDDVYEAAGSARAKASSGRARTIACRMVYAEWKGPVDAFVA
jgi:hypothetical protein